MPNMRIVHGGEWCLLSYMNGLALLHSHEQSCPLLKQARYLIHLGRFLTYIASGAIIYSLYSSPIHTDKSSLPLSSPQRAQSYPATATDSQGSPASNQGEAAKRRHWPHELEALRIKHKQVNAATEHRHARDEEAAGILGCPGLRGERGHDQSSHGVDQLILGGCSPVLDALRICNSLLEAIYRCLVS